VALAPAIAFAQQPAPESGPSAPAAPDAAAEAAAEAATAADEAAQFAAMREEFEKSLNHRTGAIDIAKGAVSLNVPAGYYYLDLADSKKVLEDVWGNPPDDAIEGMLFKEGTSALDEGNWGVVLTYDPSGYVSDEDASKINYADLLKDMQSGEKEVNAERVRQGYPSIELVGWAATPRYDASSHKLYWAKDLIFNKEPAHTLNYSMRVLGRRGVLELNFVASMEELRKVEAASADVLAIPEFKSGYRYEDFDPKIDKKADYGIAGLVAGGAAGGLLLAKKTGLLAIGLVLIKKFWFLAVGGVIAAFGFIRNLVSGRKAKSAAGPETARDPSSLDAQLFPDEKPAENKPAGTI
jgi:uncharacterized membrane-anchored protein